MEELQRLMPLDVQLKKPAHQAHHQAPAPPSLTKAQTVGVLSAASPASSSSASASAVSSSWLSPRNHHSQGKTGGGGFGRSSSTNSLQGLMAGGHRKSHGKDKRHRHVPLKAVIRSPEETAKALEVRGVASCDLVNQ
jgi:hypothetical protein